MSHPKEYPLYEHWYRTLNWVLDRCDRMPRHTRFTVSGRIAALAIETSELLLGAIYSKERLPLLQAANLNFERLRLYFRLCKDRNYLSVAQYEYISREVNKAGAMCGGWIKSCKE